MTSLNKAVGDYGEEKAVDYLLRNGYKIIHKNFRCRLGEIDIVAQEGNYIIFIEVKSRYSRGFGRPSEAVTYSKMVKLYKTAQFYINYRKIYNCSFRFDVVEVILNKENDDYSVEIIKDAFQL